MNRASKTGNITISNICVIVVLEKGMKVGWAEKALEELVAENFPNLATCKPTDSKSLNICQT